jgi:iron-sulfur cluster assembly protein
MSEIRPSGAADSAAPSTGTGAGTKPPLSLTPAAVAYVKRSRTQEGKEGQALRVGVKAGGCSGFSYFLGFTTERKQNDSVFEYEGLSVYVDPRSLEVLSGTEIDYERGLLGAGIQFKNPRAKKSCGCGESFTV